MADFKEILDKHHPILYKIGHAYASGEDFDDLYQEMLINVWRGLPNFKENSKISTWLYKVALNTALTYVRNKNRKPKESVDFEKYENTWESAPSYMPDAEDDIKQLYSAIRQLKKEERSLILLYLDEKTYDEMAEIIGFTTSNVGVRINRIKKKLHKLLKN